MARARRRSAGKRAGRAASGSEVEGGEEDVGQREEVKSQEHFCPFNKNCGTFSLVQARLWRSPSTNTNLHYLLLPIPLACQTEKDGEGRREWESWEEFVLRHWRKLRRCAPYVKAKCGFGSAKLPVSSDDEDILKYLQQETRTRLLPTLTHRYIMSDEYTATSQEAGCSASYTSGVSQRGAQQMLTKHHNREHLRLERSKESGQFECGPCDHKSLTPSGFRIHLASDEHIKLARVADAAATLPSSSSSGSTPSASSSSDPPTPASSPLALHLPVNNDLLRILRGRLLARRMSLDHLAVLLGVTGTEAREVVVGKRRPSRGRVAKLFTTFGIDEEAMLFVWYREVGEQCRQTIQPQLYRGPS